VFNSRRPRPMKYGLYAILVRKGRIAPAIVALSDIAILRCRQSRSGETCRRGAAIPTSFDRHLRSSSVHEIHMHKPAVHTQKEYGCDNTVSRSHSRSGWAETWRLFHMSVLLSQLTRRLGQKRKEAPRLFMQIITNTLCKLQDEFRLRPRSRVRVVGS
jgi:hypothetical protein